MHAARTHFAAVAVCLGALLPPAFANPRSGRPETPDAAEFEADLPEGGSLTGRDIYDRYLDNRYRRSRQQMRVISQDPGGSAQTTVFSVFLEDCRDP